MKVTPDGNALVYCEGFFGTTYGKTANGLVRFTERYDVIAVIDSTKAGKDAGKILDGRKNGIPVVASLAEGLEYAQKTGKPVSYMVMGIAPDGGRLDRNARTDFIAALESGLNIDSGLHDFLGDDPELGSIAESKGLTIRDVRKTPPREKLHFFSGEIEKVKCLKIAILGTDSAIGKRTTAWIIIHALRRAGIKTEMIGTGQTAWMQGARYSIILDSLINDFVSGELEHAIVQAWKNESPDVIIIEGQGSLLNPAFPGGFEILAAGRPDYIIIQHSPTREEYDGFPGYKMHPLDHQIRVLELISGKKVIAVTLNHENMSNSDIDHEFQKIRDEFGIPAFDVLRDGGAGIGEKIKAFLYPTGD